MRLFLVLVFALAGAFALTHGSRATQITTETVRLSGRITDPTGAPVPGAEVSLMDKRGGTVWRTQTDDAGTYTFRVPAGSYEIAAASAGFKSFRGPDVVLVSGEAKTVDVPLEVGPAGEVVNVSSNKAEPETAEMIWNAWAEPASQASSSPTFTPAGFLESGGKDYTLVIDLAALVYGGGPGVYSKNAAARLRDWLLSSKVPAAELKLLVIPDETYFEPLAQRDRVLKLPVDLRRVRKALKEGVKVKRDPFEVLRSDPDADFSFGRVTVKLRTRFREGSGTVAVALWADGAIPVDEFSMPLCVAKDERSTGACDDAGTNRPSLAGIDPLRAAAQGRAFDVRPDAALHFIQLDGRTSIGVFRDNSWPADRYVQWNLTTDAAGVLAALQKTLLPNFDRAADDAALLQVGAELYKLLFPSPNADQARVAFSDFLRAHAKESNSDDPPSIFVRLLSDTNDSSFLIPLGLMAVDLDGRKDFLGFHFRLQVPLPVQDYRPDERCISNWVVLAPRENVAGVPPELNDARGGFSDWFTKWKLKEFEEILEFGRWVGDDEEEEREPVALFLLAHHDANSLYFADAPRISSYGIDRRFKTPSFAIVNGCGTGAPGASGIVDQLNARGISSIIATSVRVDGYLAGDFFSILGESLAEDRKGQKYPLGLAHFQALRKLRTKTSRNPDRPVAYGAKVLAYQLFGNSNLHVCSPPLKKQSSVSGERDKQ